MRVTASDFYTYHRPSECDLRVFLREKGGNEAAPGPYEEVLFRLGQRHERAHLATFPTVLDLSGVDLLSREQRTRKAVEQGAPVIYQAVLRSTPVLQGKECELVGEPDYLIHEAGRYVIRDSKISQDYSKRSSRNSPTT